MRARPKSIAGATPKTGQWKKKANRMLMVKTKLAPSAIEGIGLFADEDIEKGTVTWRFVPGFDQIFSDEQIGALPEPTRSALLNHTYQHQETGRHVYCLDNARFMNHADHPNTAGVHPNGSIEGHDIALRDIRKGEELTCDYRTFDAHVGRKLRAEI